MKFIRSQQMDLLRHQQSINPAHSQPGLFSCAAGAKPYFDLGGDDWGRGTERKKTMAKGYSRCYLLKSRNYCEKENTQRKTQKRKTY